MHQIHENDSPMPDTNYIPQQRKWRGKSCTCSLRERSKETIHSTWRIERNYVIHVKNRKKLCSPRGKSKETMQYTWKIERSYAVRVKDHKKTTQSTQNIKRNYAICANYRKKVRKSTWKIERNYAVHVKDRKELCSLRKRPKALCSLRQRPKALCSLRENQKKLRIYIFISNGGGRCTIFGLYMYFSKNKKQDEADHFISRHFDESGYIFWGNRRT